MSDIEWFTNENVESGIDLARSASRPVVVDFWHPTCLGCAKLFVRTYPDPKVRALGPRYVWIKYDTTRPNAWFKRLNGSYGHQWHPDIVVLDSHLVEQRRIIGYLPPDEFVPQLEVGRALALHYNRAHRKAAQLLDEIVREFPRAAVAPEALYWAGVAAYRAGGKTDLRHYWDRIGSEYPSSDWRLRADCLDVVLPEGGFSPADPTSIRWTRA